MVTVRTNFASYNPENLPIPESFIRSITIDSKDNVWFSASRFHQGVLVKYDGKEWTVYTPDNSDLPVIFIHEIAIDGNDNIWVALSEKVTIPYLVKISGDDWTTLTSTELGFTSYYLNKIEVNSTNELIGTIDYHLSSTWFNNGPQVFIYDGDSSKQLAYDNVSNYDILTVDNKDNISCGIFRKGYVVYNGDKWSRDTTSVKNVTIIEQAPDGKIWIGTANGVHIIDGI